MQNETKTRTKFVRNKNADFCKMRNEDVYVEIGQQNGRAQSTETTCEKVGGLDLYVASVRECLGAKLNEYAFCGTGLVVKDRFLSDEGEDAILKALRSEGYVCTVESAQPENAIGCATKCKDADGKDNPTDSNQEKGAAKNAQGGAPDVREYARFVIAAGGEDAILKGAQIAKETGAKWIGILTTTSGLRFENENPLPQCVMIDPVAIEQSTDSERAAGKGRLWAEALNRFDDYFESVVQTNNSHKDENNQKSLATSYLLDLTKPIESAIDLAVALVKNALDRANVGHKRAVDVGAKLLKQLVEQQQKTDGVKCGLATTTHNEGEYAFVVGYAVWTLYIKHLSAPSLNAAIPPDDYADLCALSAVKGTTFCNEVKLFDFLSVCDYFRRNYILNEYRIDLLARAKEINLKSRVRAWRRTYLDAGFWMQSLSVDDVLDAVRLASVQSGGLLSLLRQSGALK